MKPKSKKRVYAIIIYILCILLSGLGLGAFLTTFGQTNFLANVQPFIQGMRIALLGITVVLFVVASMMFVRVKKWNQTYLVDESDEQAPLFQKIHRHYHQAMFFNTAALIILLFTIIVGYHVTLSETDVAISIPLVDYLLLMLLGVQQGYGMSIYRQIRQVHFPLFPLWDDMKHNIYQLDEGEIQAHHSAAYQTLHHLNIYVFPGLFFILAIISIITGEVQVVGLFVVLIVYLYTAWRSYWVTGQYYR